MCFLRDRHDQAQVRLDELRLGAVRVALAAIARCVERGRVARASAPAAACPAGDACDDAHEDGARQAHLLRARRTLPSGASRGSARSRWCGAVEHARPARRARAAAARAASSSSSSAGLRVTSRARSFASRSSSPTFASSRTAIGRGDERADDLRLGLLDAPRERDLSLARQERDPPELAVVRPDRIFVRRQLRAGRRATSSRLLLDSA